LSFSSQIRAQQPYQSVAHPVHLPFAFYDSPGWVELRDDLLSTSSAASVNIFHFDFDSTAPRCIGVGYVLKGDRINAFLCTPTSQIKNRDRSAKELAEAVIVMEALFAEV